MITYNGFYQISPPPRHLPFHPDSIEAFDIHAEAEEDKFLRASLTHEPLLTYWASEERPQ